MPTNIYDQQSRNRRHSVGIIVVFVLLITAIGVFFDLLFDIPYAWRVISMPFIILAMISGLKSFRRDAMARLWSNSWIDEEEERDPTYMWLRIRILLSGFVLTLLMPLMFYSDLADRTARDILDLPFLQHVPIGTVLASVVGVACASTCLTWGPASVLWSVWSQEADVPPERLQRLLNVVDEMRLAAGIPSPQIHIVDDSDPNAFAIGSDHGNSAIIVTSGLLSALSRDELQGVIAHEMSHIRDEDTRLMTTVTVLFGAVLLISQWLRRVTFYGGAFGMKIPGVGFVLRILFFVLWLVSLMFTPVIARVMAMSISRKREYLADASAAELTRNPKALADALSKVEREGNPTLSFKIGVAQLCIVDPLGRRVNNREGFWSNLFATHPPIKNRVKYLLAMAYTQIK